MDVLPPVPALVISTPDSTSSSMNRNLSLDQGSVLISLRSSNSSRTSVRRRSRRYRLRRRSRRKISYRKRSRRRYNRLRRRSRRRYNRLRKRPTRVSWRRRLRTNSVPRRRRSTRKLSWRRRLRPSFYNPLPGRPITGRFGYRRYPRRGMHKGMDITAPYGTPIKSSTSGRVSFAGYQSGYGKTVIVSHQGGMSTLYAHLSSILVGRGRYVGRNTVIGRVGSTGFTTGPHLHFEVRINGSPVNPSPYVKGL